MNEWTRKFIALACEVEALRFGRFELKSGRISPYFFNAGRFASGRSLAGLADCYADAIADSMAASGLEFDVLFGPAYKGIPLSAAVAVRLFDRHGIDTPVAYNRKEAKDHGEGGTLVGAPIEGRVLVVDDVLSAGTAFAEARALIEAAGGRVSGFAVGLDRQERGTGTTSAGSELMKAGIDVIAIATLGDLVDALRENVAGELARDENLSAMLAYQREYGAAPGS
ncbi:orotate phosphoribosyltransferase [Wenzhouxiangella sp. XN79A]|uniref:orotate phosphoribosyltransferase n=1 Tax=Wenzhouxiangella sp. XN79A TaxID=2724193 RepID=UPI00144A75D1|nr:orotate phosphoribosyltransferase [Wenzhouxiangella sp. XN79A]NKI36147.1 orotate phosphoribosyltransferase [Wenzhouxiangella sp. XN79A]